MTANRTLPAEWAPQSAVMLTWPHDSGDWGDDLAAVEENFMALAQAITRFQPVVIGCRDEDSKQSVENKLRNGGVTESRYRLGIAPSDDVWARDHGPITVLENGETRFLNFRFNGWGGKYPAEQDNRITPALHAQGLLGSAPLTNVDCVLEGGAIETDGQGVMLTTANCLTLDSRNPGMTRNNFEALFAEWFGIHTVHWLEHGHLTGDDTDGHIDTLARFASPQCIVCQGCEDRADEQYETLNAMRQELTELRQPDGEPYTLASLPLPAAIYDRQGQRLPAGYANFLIVNNAVLMPGYGDPADHEAAQILANCFPDREIVTIDCRALIRQYGSLHCVTMQIPAPAAQAAPTEA